MKFPKSECISILFSDRFSISEPVEPKVILKIFISKKIQITPEHAIEMHRFITNSELAVIPGVHGEYIGEITTLESDSKEANFVIPMIERFLEKSETKKQ